MEYVKSLYSKFLFSVCMVFLMIRFSESAVLDIPCKRNVNDTTLPPMPKAFTLNMRVNYVDDFKSVEIRQVYNADGDRRTVEVWAGERHTKYIVLGDENVKLVINYNPDAHPTCKVSKPPIKNERLMEEDDDGPSSILHQISIAIAKRKGFKLLGQAIVDGLDTRQWVACLDDPRINIRITFANPELNPSHRKKNEGVWEPVEIEAKMSSTVEMIGHYYGFDITYPDKSEFQPPEDVYCEGFRTDRKPPTLPSYFTYQSEIVVYESSEGIAPVISHRTVYYDFPSGITRIDFQDALADNRDMFSPVTAQLKSIIHDFNSGVQYTLDSVTGGCTVDTFEATFTAVSAKETVQNVMLDTKKFFVMDGVKLSYNGEYSTRGLRADVFSGVVKNDKGTRLFHWYFSSNMTQIVENQHVEKNVLIRMLSRPETSDRTEGQLEINFYNFIQEEPSAFTYDLTSCYNDSVSQMFVLTFPRDPRLRGMGNVIKGTVQQAIKEAAGVSMQRVYVKEVYYKSPFIYAEFTLLGVPPVVGSTDRATNQLSLEGAIAKLKKSIESGEFKVTIRTKDTDVILKPQPDGLNEFNGDRSKTQPDGGYKEGSVIGLTIGMLFLGVLLGAVIINLIISKKFGVSLFQKSNYGNTPFENPLNESSM